MSGEEDGWMSGEEDGWMGGEGWMDEWRRMDG